jgi:hypothetical protein
MSEREPDSNFPGRDTYEGRNNARRRAGTTVSLLIASIAGLLLVIGVAFFFSASK